MAEKCFVPVSQLLNYYSRPNCWGRAERCFAVGGEATVHPHADIHLYVPEVILWAVCIYISVSYVIKQAHGCRNVTKWASFIRSQWDEELQWAQGTSRCSWCSASQMMWGVQMSCRAIKRTMSKDGVNSCYQITQLLNEIVNHSACRPSVKI